MELTGEAIWIGSTAGSGSHWVPRGRDRDQRRRRGAGGGSCSPGWFFTGKVVGARRARVLSGVENTGRTHPRACSALYSCDWNRYNVQYALAMSKQRGVKRPSEPPQSEEEEGDDDSDSLHLLGAGHGAGAGAGLLV